MSIGHVRDLAQFQLSIAERWYRRAGGSEDRFAKFFFYFAGFNALYFLWAKVDDLRGQPADPPSLPNETKQIQNLLGKAGPEEASRVLSAAEASVQFFLKRQAIQRMGKRTGASAGEPSEGKKALRLLQDSDPRTRLAALGAILYLVRSNLVHGNKMDRGDDEQVVSNSEGALREMLGWCIEYTHSQLRQD